ncbi:hypothetical protein ACFQT0_13495 [Hymenobacter humi]|uniref:Uncharacterized protein n=1 Tax=Hymenobacter humi TaxID=1411620 RepID=A0ABW2U767_9BACT
MTTTALPTSLLLNGREFSYAAIRQYPAQARCAGERLRSQGAGFHSAVAQRHPGI